MKFVKLMLVALALSVTAANYADGQRFGVNFLKGSVEEADFDVNVNSLFLNYGMDVADFVTVEARAGFGIGKDNVDVMGIDVGVSIDKFYGLYGKFHYEMEDGYSPYFILGYSDVSLEVEALGMTEDGSETDVSYGIGLDINGDNGIFSVEYMMYMDKDGVEFNALSFGYSTTF